MKNMKIVYTCPKCGKDLRCIMLTLNPPVTKYECEKCGWSSEEPEQYIVRVPYPSVGNQFYQTNACDQCSNNPKNGGSGNCNCTLGTIKVTC